MNIEVISVDEETGKVELELDEAARAWLVEVGFNKVLRDALDRMERDKALDELVAQGQQMGLYDDNVLD